MDENLIVVADNGTRLAIGSRVHTFGDEHDVGAVTEITDPDADVDGDGRVHQFPVKVSVLYDTGETDSFSTHYDWISDRWLCDDLAAIESAEKKS